MTLSHKIIALASLAISACADQGQSMQAAAAQTPQNPNPKARWGTSDSGNFFIQGEVLWVKPLGLNFRDLPGGFFNADNGNYSYFDNNFTTGERVAVGYNTSYDGWDAVLEYTGFHYQHTNTGEITSILGNEPLRVKHSIYFNQGDLDFGRMMKISRKLKARPHVGARVLWISERATTDYVTSYSSDKVKATLGGLELGVDSVWMFAKEFGIYANLGFTTLVNQAKNIRSSDSSSTQTSYGSKVVTGLDVKVGVRWDKNFQDDSYHFGINFGYEQHSLINMLPNTPSTFIVDTTNFIDPDFTWQAIALGGRFDF